MTRAELIQAAATIAAGMIAARYDSYGDDPELTVGQAVAAQSVAQLEHIERLIAEKESEVQS